MLQIETNSHSYLAKMAAWIELKEGSVDMEKLAARMVGFVGSDIEEFVSQLCMSGSWRVVSLQSIDEVLNGFTPRSRRGIAVEYSRLHWDDIGGLEEIKSKLRLITERSDAFAR